MTRKATVTALLAWLHSQLGTVERGGPHGDDGNLTPYGAAYGWNGVAWCSIFVWAAFFKGVGIDLKKLCTTAFAGCIAAVDGWRRAGAFHPGVKGMRPGDPYYLDFPGEASVDHTGVCTKLDRDGVHGTEGNTTPAAQISDPNGGGVYERLRPTYQVVGYARVPGLRYDLRARVRHVAAKAKAHVKRYPILHPGSSSGRPVTRLQQLLNRAGDHVHVDGVYGAETLAAVKTYQRARHLHVDGVAGPKTLAALKY